MNPGRLRERVTFQKRSTALNSYREAKDAWSKIVSCWASVDPISGREFFTAMQVQSDITFRITCRYSNALSKVTAQDRIIHGNKIYDIRHPPIDVNSRHREMQFMCTEHVGE